MSDNNETAQVVVNGDPTWDQTMAGLRQFGTAALAFAIGRHLIEGDLATLLGVGGMAGIAWLSQVHTRHRAKQLANIARDPRVPDAVAKIA